MNAPYALHFKSALCENVIKFNGKGMLNHEKTVLIIQALLSKNVYRAGDMAFEAATQSQTRGKRNSLEAPAF